MLYLITGGSGSGKSAYAEEEILRLGGEKRIYIATMQPFDEESVKRIEKHRTMRSGKGFETIERYTNMAGLDVPEGADVLLECMSNLAANELYSDGGAGEDTVGAVLAGIRHLVSRASNLVIVTNEICSDIQDYSPETQAYMACLGAINCRLAKEADSVTEVVYGIPVAFK